MPSALLLTASLSGHRSRPRPRPWVHAPDPLASGPREAPDRAVSGEGRPSADVRLLIVDDDPLMTDLLPRKLARAMQANVRILTASNATDAEALIEHERPDIVLSDFNLREAKTGLDVLANAARATPNAARILFSGHTPNELGRPLAGADIHGYIEKPMKLDDLVASLLVAIRDATGMDLAREGDDAPR